MRVYNNKIIEVIIIEFSLDSVKKKTYRDLLHHHGMNNVFRRLSQSNEEAE